MRLSHWVLGVVLGVLVGGTTLVMGTLGLLVVVPAIIWAAFERARPFGLAGLLVGLGVGVVGLLAAAAARCAGLDASADGLVHGCSGPDLTPLLAFSVALIAIGVAVTFVGLRRTGNATG
jgi:hypothetical protein